jgi:MipA family protein
MRGFRLTGVLAMLLSLCRAASVLAADDCMGPSSDCVAVGHWNFSVALGAGVRTNPVVHGTDIPLVVIPQFSYYGKRVFIENLDLGVTLAESDSNAFSLVASPGYDRVFFYRSDLQNIFLGGLPGSGNGAASGIGGNAAASPPGSTTRAPFPSRSRQVTYLAGPEWTFKVHGLSGQVDVLHEITGHDHGDEIRTALAVPLTGSQSPLTASLGLTWKSAAIVNYYYGAPNIYQGGSAVNPFMKLSYTRPLSRKWRLTALLQYERLGKAIADSPIVTQHYVATVFAGATYGF